jgi:hypothetical protein
MGTAAVLSNATGVVHIKSMGCVAPLALPVRLWYGARVPQRTRPGRPLTMWSVDRQPQLDIELPQGWRARYTLVPQDGQAVVAELRVFREEQLDPPLPRGGLTSRLLRQIPITAHLRIARKTWQQREDEGRNLFGLRYDSLGAWGFTRAALQDPLRPGRKGHPDLLYAKLSSDYVRELARGTRNPVASIARRQHFSPSWVSQLIVRCRQKGFLTAAPVGRAGGQLTEAALAVLRSTKGRKRDGVR